jgi:hypothetical protein
MADHILPVLNEQMFPANAHDTDRFLGTYLHSPDLIFIVKRQVIPGWDSLHKQQLKWWKNGKSDVVYNPIGRFRYSAAKARYSLQQRREFF